MVSLSVHQRSSDSGPPVHTMINQRNRTEHAGTNRAPQKENARRRQLAVDLEPAFVKGGGVFVGMVIERPPQSTGALV